MPTSDSAGKKSRNCVIMLPFHLISAFVCLGHLVDLFFILMIPTGIEFFPGVEFE